jgi:formate dehydrogenase
MRIRHPVVLCRLLGTTENALGLRDWLKERGHTLVVTSDKEGDDSELDKNLPDTDILITTVRTAAA